MISAVSAHSDLSSRTHQRSRFSWNFWRESIFPSNIFQLKVTHLPKFLFRYLFCFSGQKVQRAGVRLDHEAMQNIVRFFLLTFRYVFHPNIFCPECGGCVLSRLLRVYSVTFVSPGQPGREASLGTTSCRSWKKAATSGPELPFRCCTGCGANTVHRSMLSRRSRPCSASARCVQI